MKRRAMNQSGTVKVLASLVVLAMLTGVGCQVAYGLSLAPNFTLTDIEGTTFSLSDFRGKVVLLEFMRTWCSKCQTEVSELIEVQNEFGNLIEIISLGIDENETNEDLREFRDGEREPNIAHSWIYARSPSSVYSQYNVNSTPTTYILDQDGYIRYLHAEIGDHAVVDAAVFIAEIQSLLTYSVTVATSPSIDNAHFRIDDSDYYTTNGTIDVPLFHGVHQVELIDTMIEADGIEYYFAHWNGSATGSANPLQLNVTGARYVEAFFDTQDLMPPTADAGLDQVVNEDTLVTLDGSASTDNVGVTNYAWTLVDGSLQTLTGEAPTYTFASPGVYTVTLNVTDATGNWATDTIAITVADITSPNADAGISQTVHKDTLFLFDANGSVDNVGIVNYVWTFLDGSLQTLTGEAPTYTFASPGVYMVTLNVTDATGNWATDTIAITVVVGIPTADAGLDQVVEEDTMVTFNGSASWDEQGLATYTWTLIDSTLQTLNGPNHSYIFTNPGNYSITLTVNDSHGTEATDTTQVTVLDVTQPEASITCNQTVTQGVALQISAENSTDNGQITHYTWDFGDDTQGSGIATNHIYANPGDYTIVLTLTDGGGNIATTQHRVSVLPNEGGIGLMTWLPILIIPGVLLVLILKRTR